MFRRGPHVTLGQTRQCHSSNLVARRRRSPSSAAVFWHPVTWAMAALVGMTIFGSKGGLFHDTRGPHSLILRNLSTDHEDLVWQWQPHGDDTVAKPERRYPMQFQYNLETGVGRRIQLQQRALMYDKPTTFRPRRQPNISDQDDDDNDEDDDAVSEGCQFINPKHNKDSPNCVAVHEIDKAESSVTFITCGGSRCAFYLPDSEVNGNPYQSAQRVVLKTQKYRKEAESHRLEDARQDGLVMEVATHSNFVMNVYGVCGTAQLTEYGDRGNMHDLIKVARQANSDIMKSLDKLKILIHIASAVTDLHDDAVAVAHGDICCHQFIWMDGFYKLNDFHMSSFLQINPATSQTCKGRNPVASAEYLWRAPEESEMESELIDLKKVDVWMMGQTMFYLYTKNWLYEGVPEEKALFMFHKQRLSAFPSHLDTNVPANAAMQSVISQCWAHDPEVRPSARQVRDFLLQELSTILGRTVGPRDADILRVEIPPLPKNHRFTGSSMDDANEEKKARRHIRYASE